MFAFGCKLLNSNSTTTEQVVYSVKLNKDSIGLYFQWTDGLYSDWFLFHSCAAHFMYFMTQNLWIRMKVRNKYKLPINKLNH